MISAKYDFIESPPDNLVIYLKSFYKANSDINKNYSMSSHVNFFIFITFELALLDPIYFSSNFFETNTPQTNNPNNTTQKIIVQSVEWGNSCGINANFSCAAAITNNLIPTQPTIKNAAISSPGLVSKTFIKMLAA